LRTESEVIYEPTPRVRKRYNKRDKNKGEQREGEQLEDGRMIPKAESQNSNSLV